LRRVVILQEYIPIYRVPFFEALRARAAMEQIDLVVACGKPNESQDLRGDSGTVAFVTRLRQREFSIFGRRLVFRQVADTVRGADLVILEQARRNLDGYWLLGPFGRVERIALWGHGRDYTRPTKFIDRLAQRWLTSRSDWFFAYTEGGMQAVTADGYPRSRTTVVQNSIDTTDLRREIAAVTPKEISDFSKLHDLQGKTAIFVGALDESKRLPFLFEAAEIAHKADAAFRLIVAGDGGLREEVQSRTASAPWVTYLGPISGDVKAVALASAQVMAMPGRVGLVAVDSFAAGKPIVTTNWPWHAPEFEYLRDGWNCIIARDLEVSYAASLVGTLRDHELLTHLAKGCLQDSRRITLDSMVDRFLEGIEGALNSN